MTALDDLLASGLALWLDGVHRGALIAGRAGRLIDRLGISGATVTPEAVEHAVAAGQYDDALAALRERGITDPAEAVRSIVNEDVATLAAALQPRYESTGGTEGWVCVHPAAGPGGDDSDPVDAALAARASTGHPNVLVEVPPRTAGAAVIEELIASGVPVSAGPLCDPVLGAEVVSAWGRGLERRLGAGLDAGVPLVVAMPVSPVDVAADPTLPFEWRGRLAIAVARQLAAAVVAPAVIDGWAGMQAAGARPPQVHWCDVLPAEGGRADNLYLAALAAPRRVARVPIDVLAPLTGGDLERAAAGNDEAASVVAAAGAAGLDVDALLRGVEQEAVERIGWARARLLDAVSSRLDQLGGVAPAGRYRLPAAVDKAALGAADDLADRDAGWRLWARDHTLWQDDPIEVADRLGWLVSPRQMRELLARLDDFADAVAGDGFTDAVLMGMGGSSLFPEVLARAHGPASGRLRLHVLDTTDPAAVLRLGRTVDPERTLFVASSKSGSTIETTSQLAHFWDRIGDGSRFVAVTDPGSALAELAVDRGFRAVFQNRPDIGGRYSALSWFGLVPGALLGVDIDELLQRAAVMLASCGPGVRPADNPGLRLGAVLAGAAREGRDKLTLVLPEAVTAFATWLEQLLAESTGKAGAGILPVADEPLGSPDVYGSDRVFVVTGAAGQALDDLAGAGHPVIELPWGDPADLGSEVVRWEVATAMVGAVLGINPFDQPDVAAAKEATARVLADGLPAISTEPLAGLVDAVRPGDYLAIHAYVDPGSEVVAQLQAARVALRDRLRVATTLGLGPRFLHSTGQLHKGGPQTGVFVQVVGDDPQDAPIPGRPYGFSTLKQAQAAGDLAALRDRGLRAGRVALDDLLAVVP